MKSPRRSFTLIELLITISIIAIMSVVALPLFSTYQKRNTVISDADNLLSFFSYARALNNNPDYNTRDKSAGFKVIFSQNTDGNYSVKLESAIDSTDIDQFNFGSGETLAITADSVDFVFPPAGGDFTANISGTPPAEVMKCDSNCDTTLKVKILNSGFSKEVTVQNSSVSAGTLFSTSVSE